MAPKLGGSDLLKRLKEKKELEKKKENPQTVAEDSQDTPPGSPPQSLRPRKRGRSDSDHTDVGDSPSVPDAAFAPSSSDPPSQIPKTSLWSNDYPASSVIDKHLANDFDTKSFQESGMLGMCRVLMANSLRCASIARFAEKHHLKTARAFDVIQLEKKRLVENSEQLKNKITGLESGVRIANVHIEKLEGELKGKIEREQDLLEENSGLKASLDDLKNEALDQHVFGFEKALAQVKLLYPEINLKGCDVAKEVRDGKLVDLDGADATPEDPGNIVESPTAEGPTVKDVDNVVVDSIQAKDAEGSVVSPEGVENS